MPRKEKRSLFDKIFGARPRKEIVPAGYWQTFTAYRPSFRTRNGEIYEAELVRAAIEAKARHVSKLKFEMFGAAKPKLRAKMQAGPNAFQTYGQMLARTKTILEVQNTCFIVPVLDEYDEPTGIFPVLPSECKLMDYRGEPFLVIEFEREKRKAAIELSRVGIMTKFQYRSDLFGESNEALRPTMEVIDLQNQGISEGVKSAATFRFMGTMENYADPEDVQALKQEFNEMNFRSKATGGGLLLFDRRIKDAKQIESKPFVADAKEMEMIRESVNAYFGVNSDVMENKAFGDSWAAFYEGEIEPFAIQFSEVVTKMLFTELERGRGNKVMLTANRLQYMSNSDKLALTTDMADRGLMTRNEIREIWNLPPLPQEIGDTLPVRGEYYNVGDNAGEE